MLFHVVIDTAALELGMNERAHKILARSRLMQLFACVKDAP